MRRQLAMSNTSGLVQLRSWPAYWQFPTFRRRGTLVLYGMGPALSVVYLAALRRSDTWQLIYASDVNATCLQLVQAYSQSRCDSSNIHHGSIQNPISPRSSRIPVLMLKMFISPYTINESQAWRLSFRCLLVSVDKIANVIIKTL